MYEVRNVDLGLIEPNPYRNLRDYPWLDYKIEQLRRSIRDVGFWAGVIGRAKSDRFELAFGHHRVEAARRNRLREIPLIVEQLTDRQMLEYMGRENGEDYGTEFLVLLNTWEGAVDFFQKNVRTTARTSGQPTEIARVLGWTSTNHSTKHRGEDQMSRAARACSAAHALIVGKHLRREDLRGLSVREAQDLTTTTRVRIEQADTIGKREGHSTSQTRRAQKIIAEAAKEAADSIRAGKIAPKDRATEIDLTVLRKSGTKAAKRTPLFAVFGEALCVSIAKMLHSDSAADKIAQIEQALDVVELDEDKEVLRKLHHELDELARRAARAKARTTIHKVVSLKAIAGRDEA